MKTLRVQIIYHTDKQDSFFLMTRAYYSRVNILKVSLLIGVLFIRCVQVAVVTKSTTSRKQRVGRLRSSRLGFLLSLSLCFGYKNYFLRLNVRSHDVLRAEGGDEGETREQRNYWHHVPLLEHRDRRKYQIASLKRSFSSSFFLLFIIFIMLLMMLSFFSVLSSTVSQLVLTGFQFDL